MEIKRNIMKDRNSESPESSLKVNYVVNFGKDMTQRTVKLNPVLFRNNKIIIPKKKFRISESRKEEFNSYSNENMDFFRLDHISECDRNNYHNIFMDKLKPINRSSNFQKFNEIRMALYVEHIYLVYLSLAFKSRNVNGLLKTILILIMLRSCIRSSFNVDFEPHNYTYSSKILEIY